MNLILTALIPSFLINGVDLPEHTTREISCNFLKFVEQQHTTLPIFVFHSSSFKFFLSIQELHQAECTEINNFMYQIKN